MSADRTGAAARIAPGDRVGPYEVLGLLGSGGMGEVYRARDPRLGREVAIKVLPADMSSDPDRLRRFEQEARAAGALSHSNLLSVFDTGLHDGAPYIVFELLEGRTLRQALGAGALPPRKALDYAQQIAQGLVAAHDKGIVHRDLKPENLFVTKDGVMKLLDFGLAKLRPALEGIAVETERTTFSQITEAGAVLGTVGYMSPEQVRGNPADHRSDIFSFGAVLYEMLSGRRPFSGDSTPEVMTAILKHDPPELTNPDLPPGLEGVVRRCLGKRPEERFQSARDIGFALEAVREAGLTRPTALPWPRNLAVVARRPLLAVVAAASLLAASLLLSWLSGSRPTPHIAGSTQLTFIGTAMSFSGGGPSAILTDGARIYFTDGEAGPGLAYVSTEGGDVVHVPGPVKSSLLLGLSPEGGRLLVKDWPSIAHTEGPLWAVPTSGGAPRRLGDVIAQAGSWSSDGRSLVYARGEELYLASNDGGQARMLARTPGRAYWIRWSPDGRHLRLTLHQTESQRWSLWEVAADGTDLHALPLQWDERPQACCCGSWSRDGRSFVFSARHEQGVDLWMLDEAGSLFRGRSWKPRRLTTDSLEAFVATPSVDGKKLYAAKGRSSQQVVRYDPRSRRLAAADLPRGLWVRFSPDGQWVVYVQLQGGREVLKRSRPDGSQALQLTTPPMSPYLPRWSPDGKRIAFSGTLPGKPEKTYVVSSEGGAPEQVLPGERHEVDVDWSPDGRSLIFGRPPDGAAEKGLPKAIHLVDLETKQVSSLPHSEGLFAPVLSPDRRHVVATALDGHKLMIFDFETGKWSDFAGPGIGVGFAGACRPLCANVHWSQNGRYVYVSNLGTQVTEVLRVAVADRRVERVLGLGDLGPTVKDFDTTGLTPDGSLLLVTTSVTSDIHALEWRVP